MMKSNEDADVDIDEAPPPFQYPPGALISNAELPEEYMYYAETHLNWHVVYTVRNSTMEIVGINNSLSINLIDPSIAQCRDGHCKRLRCDADKYSMLELERADLRKSVKDIESKIESSHEAYGSIACVSEDDFGYFVDMDGRMPADESELDTKKNYHRQFTMSSASPAV